MSLLIDDEIRTLRILAGQLPRRIGSTESVCIQALEAEGLCSSDDHPTITLSGIKMLESLTGTIDFRSRWIPSR